MLLKALRERLWRGFALLAIFLLSAVSVAWAQSGAISGTVVDSHGVPIPGAYVLVDGTSQGTVTDMDGKFSIAAKAGSQLNFSFIGYESVALPAQNGMTVTMTDASEMLGDIEVVAYGAQKKVTVTGAISSIKSEDLLRTPVSSVNNVLAGQLSGVTTIQYSGEPGENSENQIFVRGKATFNDKDGAQAPLVQVDGVEREMFDIDPNEIESVTVLKDASATAVFGVRGANGVILITTKRGKEGKAHINVSTAFSALMPTKMVEMTDSYQYGVFYNQQRANDGNSPVFSDALLDKFKNPKSEVDKIRFPSHDWADYTMKDVTLQTQSNLSIDGGNDKVRYFVSVGLFTQGGVFDTFDLNYDCDYRYKRMNYRTNVDIDVTKTTLLSVNIAGKLDRTNKPITGQGSSGMVKNIYFSTPFSSAGIIDGKLIYPSTDTNENEDGIILPFVGTSPFAYYTTGGYYRQDNMKISTDLILTQKLDMLTEGLSVKLKGSYNSNYYIQKECSGGSVATYTAVYTNNELKYKKTGEDKDPASYKNNLGKGRDWYFEGSINYARSFGLHNVSALVLYNQSKEYYPKTYKYIPRTYVGLVGRISYDYANKYMAEFNYGRNGSENFAPENRYGSFPAGSIGWALSEEDFFEGVRDIVSFLKLRASWGLVGNDKVSGSRFMYTPDPVTINTSVGLAETNGAVPGGYQFGTNPVGVTPSYDNSYVPGAGNTNKYPNNKDATWETAFKQDYGLDLNFLDNKITTTFDYYFEKRTDIMAQNWKSASITGLDPAYTNFGEVHSWGWEASVGTNIPIGEDVRIWGKLNISYNQNEIITDGQAPQENEFMKTEGRRIGSRSQLLFFGLSEGAQIDNERYKAAYGTDLPKQSFASQIKPGDALFVDLDGNGVVDANDNSRNYGYTDDPEYIAGFNIGAGWKGLSVSMQWVAAWNVSRMIESTFRQPFVNASGTTQGSLLQYHVDNTWTVDNPDPSAKYPRATWTNAAQNYATSTLYEQDSKYLRLKTAEISYRFDLPFMKTLGMKTLQLSLSGYNLITFTPYLWGDPESKATQSPTYPLQRTYTASLKLSF